MPVMKLGIIGSGSWATALAKILTDNHVPINWLVRNEKTIEHIVRRHHNPNYLSSAYFDTSLLNLSTDIREVIQKSEVIIIAVPSAYITSTFGDLPRDIFRNKKVVSAVKGILPGQNILLNDYLKESFQVSLNDYFTIMGPCHAEEIAAEKLSYLTFSGVDEERTSAIATHFKCDYLNTVINNDVYGVQYAAVLKNIYALGAGIAHGLEYGDNFLSVLIANSADEMAGFLQKAGIRNIEIGVHEPGNNAADSRKANYAASVYLGDLLVTCYSPYSRNRTFGNMIGKGYSVRATQLEMNMVAEGYNASQCMYVINKEVLADMPIAETVYKILWQQLSPGEGFKAMEHKLL